MAIVLSADGIVSGISEDEIRAWVDIVMPVSTPEELIAILGSVSGAGCILVLDSPHGIDFELLRSVRGIEQQTAVVACMQNPDLDDVVDAMRFGVVDVLDGEPGPIRFRAAIERALNCVSVRSDQAQGLGTLRDAMREPERQIILDALVLNHWNRVATARQLGIDRTTLYKKMKHLGIAA